MVTVLQAGAKEGTIWSISPTPCPAGRAGSGATQRGKITAAPSNLLKRLYFTANQVSLPCTCPALHPDERQWRTLSPTKRLCQELPQPQKTSSDKLCSSTFVLPLRQMGGLLPGFCFRLCSQLQSSRLCTEVRGELRWAVSGLAASPR